VNHLGASYSYGQFTDIAGKITFDASKPEGGSVDVTIKTESVTTFNEMRDRHLKSPDFFNAKEFPALTFKSTAWKKTGEKTFDVTGDLTINGKTKQITVPVQHVGDGKNQRGQELTGFHTTFKVDRTEFGMNYGVAETGGLGKDVDIIFSVEAIKN
jgi:polyisoprenoid-binding protein YceI